MTMRVVFLLMVFLLPGCSGSSTPDRNALENKNADNKEQPKEKLPYPECAAIIKYLKDKMGEPDSLQIAEWKSRDVLTDDSGFWKAGEVIIKAHYRGKNEKGIMQAYVMLFRVSGSQVIQMWKAD